MAESYEAIALDRVGTDGRVGRITLNRPEKMNAITPRMMAELNQALHEWEADDSVRVIVLRGAGRAFSAGYDLTGGGGDYTPDRQFRNQDDKGRRLVVGGLMSLQETVDKQIYMWNMAKVTIAQIHGHCLAGGLELVMFCDLVTAAENTQIGHVGVRGLGIPRNGALLPLVMPMRKAKELYLTGTTITGTEAAHVGMINYAWPAEELEERTTRWADMVANLSPDHLALLKAAMNKFWVNMGFHSSVRSQTDITTMGGQTEQAYMFWEKMSELGLREAVAWRDSGYRDYREVTGDFA